jgi:signal transduction histidine kinase
VVRHAKQESFIMTTAQDDAIALYLQRIQPYDLATIRSQVEHDVNMLVGSFASYAELLEALYPKLMLPDDIRGNVADYCAALRYQLTKYPTVMAWYATEAPSMTVTQYLACLLHDLLNPMSVFRGYTALLEYDLEAHPLSVFANQRAIHLVKAMISTTDRMIVVLSACQMALQLHRTAS